MILYELPSGCSLRLLEEADADALFAVIDRNRDHLRRWLPWVDGTRDAASALEFVRMARRQAETNDGMQAAVVDGGAIIGVAGFHRVDWANRVTSIGYWLSADRQGRGTMTEAVATLVDVAFGVWRLNRVEIQAAVENRRSRAIPERLGFREEGVRRQAERHGDRYLDLVLYAMLAADWRPAHGGHGHAAPGEDGRARWASSLAAMSTVSAEQAILDGVKTQLFIGGEWRDAGEGGTIPVEDPATGETISEVADATVEDAKAALGAAHDAFPAFRGVAPRERGDILRRAYDLIMERADDLAVLMTMEMGKPVAESRAEVVYAANFFRWYAEEAVRINGRFTTNEAGTGKVLTMQQPVGPCIFITPWNFPLAMGTRKIGPAVAAGCTMVVKPAKQTPLSMLALAQVLEEAGLPGGVVNVITASRSGATMEPIIKDPRARKLSFTGSTEVGRELIRQSADQILRVSMELGGNAPFLVFEDADLDAAVDGAVLAKMRNVGEACTAANRFHVAASIADEFAQRLADRLGEMKVGRGTEPDVKVGPLIDESQRDKVDELVRDAVQKGATVLVGGEKLDGPGHFYKPTVITGVPDDAKLLREEIFGPVAPVKGFGSEDEAIAAANDTEYGLVAYVYTRDLARAHRVMDRLETGMIGLNQGMVSNAGAPFGGVKHSGYGREGGPEGMHEYLETKYVAMNV